MDQSFINFLWYLAWFIAATHSCLLVVNWGLGIFTVYMAAKTGAKEYYDLIPRMFDWWFVFYHVWTAVAISFIIAYW